MDDNNQAKTDNTETVLDLGAEFRNTFDLAGIQARYMQMAGDFLLNSNPTKAYVEGFQGAPDNIRQNAVDRLGKSANVWLDMWESYLQAGKTVPGDLIAYVATLARQNREKLDKH